MTRTEMYIVGGVAAAGVYWFVLRPRGILVPAGNEQSYVRSPAGGFTAPLPANAPLPSAVKTLHNQVFGDFGSILARAASLPTKSPAVKKKGGILGAVTKPFKSAVKTLGKGAVDVNKKYVGYQVDQFKKGLAASAGKLFGPGQVRGAA